MLACNDLEYHYTGEKNMQFPSLDLAQNEHCLILGNSGSGKTTFLHLLAGLLSPKKGVVMIDNIDLKVLSKSALDRFRGQKMGMVFQKAFFIKAVSVLENLLWAQSLAGKTVDKSRALHLLERLDIIKYKNHKPEHLSVGEQQRASIARALINSPSVILADEPSSALDDKNAASVIRLLEEQAALENASLIIVTHDARIKSHFKKQIILQA